MNPLAIIAKYYDSNSPLYHTLLTHSHQVQQRAVAIANENRGAWSIDVPFVEEASLLHDIGIFLTDAPSIHCHGTHPYIAHGYLGADLLREEGYERHALVCERHTGCGLSEATIRRQQLPLPMRCMEPVSIEEQIICFADKFYSKTHLGEELPLDKIRGKMRRLGEESLQRFDYWYKIFYGVELPTLGGEEHG